MAERWRTCPCNYTKNQHWLVPKPGIINSRNLVTSAMASPSVQSFYDQLDLFGSDEEYLLLRNVAAMTPG
jgi:hypothetical protein